MKTIKVGVLEWHIESLAPGTADLLSCRTASPSTRKLEPGQLNCTGQVAEVESVGFYHGGDVLYKLKGMPGTWHERCLKATP